MRAGHDLHLGEHPATAPRCGRCRPSAPTSGRSTPETAKTWSRTTSTSGPASYAVAELVVERPDRGQPGQQPAPRLVGALRQGQEPAAGVVAVVGQLLDALGRDRGEHRVAVRRPAARTPPAGRSRTAAAGRSSARSRRSRPRPAGRCGSRSPRGRRPARPRPAPASPRAAPARRRVGGRGAGQQQPGLAEQVERDVGQRDVLLEVGRVAAPLARAGCDSTSASSPSSEAVRRELGRVEAVRHGRVDAGERVLEVGAEGPLRRVGAEQAVVDAAVLVVGVGSGVAHRAHMWGTSSGIV